MEERLKDSRMLNALQAIHIENQTLQNTLQEILLIKKSLEANLDSEEKQLSALFQEENQLQATHTINLMKIRNVEKEVNKSEAKQEQINRNIQNVIEKIKECKENLDAKANKFTLRADYLCGCFLSVVQRETAESNSLEMFDGMNNLKFEIERKEEAIAKIKRELEEFVIFEVNDNLPEFSVTLEEQEVLMNAMEDQYLSATRQFDELNISKSRKQFEELRWERGG